MWRAIFFAAGLFVTSWGGSFLLVDKIVLTMNDSPPPIQRSNDDFRGLFVTRGPDNKATFDPPEWAAFTLMSIGAVTMLYAIALPKRNRG